MLFSRALNLDCFFCMCVRAPLCECVSVGKGAGGGRRSFGVALSSTAAIHMHAGSWAQDSTSVGVCSHPPL